MIVTVGPLLSHPLWKVLAAQPSTDARQQRFHREDLLWATGLSHVLKWVKYLTSFPTIAESVNPPTRWKKKEMGSSDVGVTRRLDLCPIETKENYVEMQGLQDKI